MKERLQEGFGGKKIEFNAYVPTRNKEGFLVNTQRVVKLMVPVAPTSPKVSLPSPVRL